MVTPSSGFKKPDMPSTEISENSEADQTMLRAVARRLYQRRVTVTFTRREAELVKALLLAGSVNKGLAAQVADHIGHSETSGRVMLAVKNAWKKLDTAVIKRDEGQRRKENGKATIKPVDGDDDLITLF